MDQQPEWANELYESPRHGIPYNDCPEPQKLEEYGAILDSVLEIADALVTSNGMSAPAAIRTVCNDEGWVVLPQHRQRILDRLK